MSKQGKVSDCLYYRLLGIGPDLIKKEEIQLYLHVKIADFRHMEDVGCVLMTIGSTILVYFLNIGALLTALVGALISVLGFVIFLVFGWAKARTEESLRSLLLKQSPQDTLKAYRERSS